jgi:RNA polymerase sigma factor (sigma-70 family)
MQMLVEIVRSSLRPVTEKELVRHASAILDQAWAVVGQSELRAAISQFQPEDVDRDGTGRLVAATPSIDLATSLARLANATALAELIADTEPPPARPSQSFSYDKRLFRRDLLTVEQERHLGLRAQRNDRAAINELVEANLRLAADAARRRRPTPGYDNDDAFQEAVLGLLRAAEKFDPWKGFRFSTYASQWIGQRLDRSRADLGRTVRLPVHVDADLRKYLAIERRLERYGGRPPTADDIARVAGTSSDAVRKVLRAPIEPLSLDAEAANVSDRTTPDPSEEVLDRCAVDDLFEMLDELSERERAVLLARYGIGRPEATLEEIGNEFGVTRERIRQIEDAALKRLTSIARNRECGLPAKRSQAPAREDQDLVGREMPSR